MAGPWENYQAPAPEPPKGQGELGYAPAPTGSVPGSMVGETKPPATPQGVQSINVDEFGRPINVDEFGAKPPSNVTSYDVYPGRNSYSPYIPPGPGMAETSGPGRIVQKAEEGWQGGVVFKNPQSVLGHIFNAPFQLSSGITSGALETINQLFGHEAAGTVEALLTPQPEIMAPRGPIVTKYTPDPAPVPALRPPGGPDLNAPPWAPQNQLAPEQPPPPPAPPAGPPPPAPGTVRLYHNGADPTSGGGRWVTPNPDYAQNWRPGGEVHYVDVPEDHPAVQAATDYNAVAGTNMKPPLHAFEAPEDIAKQLKPIGAPQPQPSGAQVTPASVAALTPQQVAEYGSVADKQWLYKSMPPGEQNTIEYVKGNIPTMVQREQTVNAARDAKTQRNLSPQAAEDERVLMNQHSENRKDMFQEIAGSDVTQGIAIRDANDAIEAGLKAAFDQGGRVNPQPVADAIQTELGTSAGKLPPLKAAMKTVSDALQTPDGSGMETDPQKVYAVRRVINYLQSKRGITENPGYGDRDVQSALIRVKGAIDKAIEPAAPGFGEAIDNYSTAQRAIEAREALQAYEPKLYDQYGNMQFSRIHNLMRDIVVSRDPNAPLNPYQSLTDEQMNGLKSIHDDLMRASSAQELEKARQSDTAQNILDAVKQAAQGVPGTIAAGIAGHVVSGPAGAVVGSVLKQQIQAAFSRGAERRATRRMGEILYPSPTEYPTTPNPLLQPPP